jgi:putative redox protein
MVNSQSAVEESVVAKATGGGKFQVRIETGDHDFVMDEPVSYGGLSSGPNPFDLLEAALAGCTLMTLRLYAERKGWDLDGVRVRVTHRKGSGGERDRFEREVELGNVTDEQRERLLQIAERCPVHLLLDRGADVSVSIAQDELTEPVTDGLHASEMDRACRDTGQPF